MSLSQGATSSAISSALPTDALLLKAGAGSDSTLLPGLLRRLQDALPATPSKVRAAVCRETNQLYAYLHFHQLAALGKHEVQAFEATLKSEYPLQDLTLSRLQRVASLAGASAGSLSVFHYVVETDPEDGWMDEVARWYDTEHMPGLAGVPGCIRAERFLSHDHGPLSLAFYDLLTRETLVSEPWLAVRGTQWSSRVRPHFTNTLRTMFRCVAQHPEQTKE